MDASSDFPFKAIISELPSISKQKLIKRLKEAADADEVQLVYITKSSAKVSFRKEADLNRLLVNGLDVKFGENTYPVTVKKFDVQSSDAGGNGSIQRSSNNNGEQKHHPDSTNVSSFLYQPSDKESEHILRYISKTSVHKLALQKFLQQRHIELEYISESEVNMKLIKGHSVHGSDDMFEQCIANFLKFFLSWNEKLSNSSNDDGTFIIRTLNQYKPRCFGNWYHNTKTILVTGPTDVVEELKDTILQRISQNENQQTNAKKIASVFTFSDVSPGVLRFVSKQRLQELRRCMNKLACIDIITDAKITSVQVTPIPALRTWSHLEYVKVCTTRLQTFFSEFQAWKETFDSVSVRSVQQRQPNLFKENSDKDHHIKWFVDTGTVSVSGVASAVQKYRQQIEGLLKPEKHRERFYSGSDKESDRSFDEHPVNSSQRSRHISSSSDEGAIYRPESPYRRVSCNTEDIPRPVLLFVLKDMKTKKDFEKCCLPNAKAMIRSEKIDGKDKICVYANILPVLHSSKPEMEAFKSINDFFEKFETQSKKYSKEKLQELIASNEEIFKSVRDEVHIRYFLGSGTVMVTGITEKVAEKHEEIERELNVTTFLERINIADVFIAQRECDVWGTVEKSCKDSRLRVSVSSNQPGQIRFRGNPKAIRKARKLLGDNCENLFEKELHGFSDGQIHVLRNCEQSQRNYLNTNQNLLDIVYQYFRDNSLKASIGFNDAFVSLFSIGETEWENANKALQQFIVSFPVDIEKTATLSSRKALKAVKAKFKNDAVYAEELATGKQLTIYCFDSRKNEIMRKVKEVLDDYNEGAKIQHFHEMSEEEAKHLLNPHSECKIYKAEKLELEKRNAKHGLLVTCVKEDLDTVEMKLDDFLNEIVSKSLHVPGYFLYESLQKSAKHFKIERDTNCTIFFQPVKQAPRDVQIRVKHGNILDEQCDAIVNSTGSGLSFKSTSQVNKALSRKLGATVVKLISQTRQTLIPSKADVFRTLSLAPPWSFIVNVSTPNQNDALTKFICKLLEACNCNQMQSLAIPTIGTGNMGLDPDTVASCMKAAFEAYCSSTTTKHLKDIRVIVFDANLVPTFSSIVPDSGPASNGINANLYANRSDKLNQAIDLFKSLCSESVAKEVIHDPMVQEFSVFIQTQSREICKGHNVHIELTGNSGQDQCILQGPIDEVRKVREKIEKLFATGPNWTPMTGKKPYEKVQLDSNSSEYKALKLKFKQSSPSHQQIVKIERIQNPLQYQQFRARKVSKFSGNQTADVSRQLFHGTPPENVDAICLYGFNRTYAGMNGTLYGSGVYFHINASYSVQYSNSSGQKCVFLADVITGEYAQGSPELKCAPVNPQTGESFDSVVDDTSNPKIFVVFPDSSCYPSYLITFI